MTVENVSLNWLRQRLSFERDTLAARGKNIEVAQRRLNKAFEKAIKVIEEL